MVISCDLRKFHAISDMTDERLATLKKNKPDYLFGIY